MASSSSTDQKKSSLLRCPSYLNLPDVPAKESWALCLVKGNFWATADEPSLTASPPSEDTEGDEDHHYIILFL